MENNRFSDISILLDSIPAVNECLLEETSFNILDACVKKQLRETAHSRILYSLLNFDSRILESFIAYFFSDNSFHESSWNLSVEKNNIDILIEGVHNVIIIENKVNYAIEQPDQIDRYVELFNGKQINIYVIYLNRKEEYAPSPYSWRKTVNLCTLKPASYKTHIMGWLSEIMTRFKENKKLLEALNQYYDYLEILLGKKHDKMKENLKEQIFGFLKERGLNSDSMSDLDSILNELKILTDGCNELKYDLIWDDIKKEVNAFLKTENIPQLQDMRKLDWDLPDAGIAFKLHGIDADLYVVISYIQQLYVGVINLSKDKNQQTSIYEKLIKIFSDCSGTPYSTPRYPIWYKCEDNNQLIRTYCKMVKILKVQSTTQSSDVEFIG